MKGSAKTARIAGGRQGLARRANRYEAVARPGAVSKRMVRASSGKLERAGQDFRPSHIDDLQVDAHGLACLAAMHDLSAAARYADRVVLLKEGRLVADGPTSEVMTPELLSDTFDAEIVVGELPSGLPYVSATAAR